MAAELPAGAQGAQGVQVAEGGESRIRKEMNELGNGELVEPVIIICSDSITSPAREGDFDDTATMKAVAAPVIGTAPGLRRVKRFNVIHIPDDDDDVAVTHIPALATHYPPLCAGIVEGPAHLTAQEIATHQEHNKRRRLQEPERSGGSLEEGSAAELWKMGDIHGLP